MAGLYDRFYTRRMSRGAAPSLFGGGGPTGGGVSSPFFLAGQAPPNNSQSQNPFFDMFSNYGAVDYGPNDFINTPWGRDTAEESPQAAVLRSFGNYSPYSSQGRFLESQTSRILEGWKQAFLTNPELRLMDYLNDPNLMSGLTRQYALASPQTQGYEYSRYAPPSKLQPRGY